MHLKCVFRDWQTNWHIFRNFSNGILFKKKTDNKNDNAVSLTPNQWPFISHRFILCSRLRHGMRGTQIACFSSSTHMSCRSSFVSQLTVGSSTRPIPVLRSTTIQLCPSVHFEWQRRFEFHNLLFFKVF